ncbi:hypothetical protein PanWU01x14_107600 [Parasponia andersonii]|uniref:CCHC-type domain-containing protein n=1 Tax=Parasponia andersonii TaxID=3476 RepID=A0A2P5D0B2_PARAD|nr:hypothetical protein PanWU01x14_107600 [Parasponia andersonii]
MVVHNVTVVIDGMQLDPWKIDGDYASYTWLVDEIRKDLYGAQQLNFEVSFDFEGKVCRSEYMVEVVDDRSLMQLLNLNTNPIHVSELIVRTKVMHFVQVSPSPDGTTFMVKSYNNYHTYQVVISNKSATATWITKALGANFKVDSHLSLQAMRTLLKDRFGLEVEKIKLYRARNKARGEAKEDHAASYAKLRNYCHLVLATTIARWDQVLTPDVRYRVNKLLNQARTARVYRTCDYEFQVDHDERRVKVSLNDRSCDCDEGLWPQFDDDQLLAPPKLVRPPNRPKKHQRRDRDEARLVTHRSATVKCGRCGIYGHNVCSCPGPSNRSNVGRKAKGKRPALTVVDQPARPAKVQLRATQNKRRNASAPRPVSTQHATMTNIVAAYYASVSRPTTAHNNDGGQLESSTQTLASQLTQDVSEFAAF